MLKKPSWIKVKLPSGEKATQVEYLLKKYSLNTVCKSALCPNIGHCFSKGTATFLILGKNCTRNCKFCNIEKGIPQTIDKNEPQNILQIVKILNLKKIVITSVTRDDLKDKGAKQFVEVIKLLKENTITKVEVLVPDFSAKKNLIKKVIEANPDIFSHNIETAHSLYKTVRPKSNFKKSLKVLAFAKKINPRIITKSVILLGLNETMEEIIQTLKMLKKTNCDIVVIGQYLQPSKNHFPVNKYYSPAEFKIIKNIALSLGFNKVNSFPLARSSYYLD